MIRHLFHPDFPTCSICLDTVNPLSFRKRKYLVCGHLFHKKCIDKIYRPNCPLCDTYIFSPHETLLLDAASRNDEDTVKKLLTEQSPNIKQLFLYVSSHRKYNFLINYLFKFCDFSQVLVDNLHNFEIASFILEKNTTGEISINWFKTFNSMTLFELVCDMNNVDDEIKKTILLKIPQSALTDDIRAFVPRRPSAPSM